MAEDEGVEATDVTALSSKWSVCKKGSGGGDEVDGAGEPTRLILGVVVGSRDSKRVMSRDTAIIRSEFKQG
jgi:hypothetical protein